MAVYKAKKESEASCKDVTNCHAETETSEIENDHDISAREIFQQELAKEDNGIKGDKKRRRTSNTMPDLNLTSDHATDLTVQPKTPLSAKSIEDFLTTKEMNMLNDEAITHDAKGTK